MLDIVYKQVADLAKGIKTDLRRKGFVVPRDNGDGTINVDRYKIIRDRSGFYKIKNAVGDIVVDSINLPQTAALLANNLALGRWNDFDLVRQDRQYGYSLFEEQLAKRIISNHKDWDKVDVMYSKMEEARQKKTSARNSILHSFEKLRNLR